MSWLVNHTQSEEYASQAEVLYRQQEIVAAVELYRLAANAEEEALNSLDCHKMRTIGITVVSAASLYYKAQEFALAKRIAYKWLATDFLLPFAIEELEELLQVIHYDESCQKSGIQSIDGEVLVSVSGRDIISGAAPLETILEKVQPYRLQSLILQLQNSAFLFQTVSINVIIIKSIKMVKKVLLFKISFPIYYFFKKILLVLIGFIFLLILYFLVWDLPKIQVIKNPFIEKKDELIVEKEDRSTLANAIRGLLFFAAAYLAWKNSDISHK